MQVIGIYNVPKNLVFQNFCFEIPGFLIAI